MHNHFHGTLDTVRNFYGKYKMQHLHVTIYNLILHAN